MAIIYSYPYVSTVNNSDTLVISVSDTTADNGFLTKSLTADDLASYVTARVNLNFLGDTGSGVVNLDTQNLTISGTSNEIETAASSQTLQIGLPDNVTIGNNLTVSNNLLVSNDASIAADLGVQGEIETGTLQVNSTAFIGGVLTMEDSINMTQNGRIINLENPIDAQDAATKQYVDTAVTGLLEFKGTFRADTGEILSGSNAGAYIYNCPGGAGARVAIAIGDYYIVANAGGQFYCSGDLLQVGDSIVASQDAGADSSTINDWGTLEGNNVEGTGLANTIPIWTDSQVLGNSPIVYDPVGHAAAPTVDIVLPSQTFEFRDAGRFITGAMSAGNTFNNATLDIQGDTNGKAATFRGGVIVSTNPGGIQVDNTSVAIGGGGNDIVSGSDHCLVVGNGNQITSSSDQSAAFGQNNSITGSLDSFTTGNSNTINSSLRTQAFGFNNTINSDSSFVAGGDNSITATNNSFILGYNHTVTGTSSKSFLFGQNITLTGGQSNYAIGTNLDAGAGEHMVIGYRNYPAGYPTPNKNLGLGDTKFIVAVGSGTATPSDNNALIITEGGINGGSSGLVPQVPRVILPTVPTFSANNDAAADAIGVPEGALYQNGGVVQINRGGGSTTDPSFDSVGINTNSPGAKLDVEGNAVIGAAGNIVNGDFAVAINKNTVVTSEDGFAQGENTIATGRQAAAFGFNTYANGPASIAGGSLSETNAQRSIAVGATAITNAEDSAAFNTGTRANGLFSFATGQGCFATNNAAFATGSNTQATGLYSFSGGVNSIASGNGAVALGGGAQCSGEFSFAAGNINVASGLNTTALGFDNDAIGNHSAVIGHLNTTSASGVYGVAINFQNTVSGQAAFAFNQGNTVSGLNAAAGGVSNTVDAEGSFAYGFSNDTSGTGATPPQQILLGRFLKPPRDVAGNAGEAQVIVGRHNKHANQPATAFAVGTGTAPTATANSLTVQYDGKVLMEQVVNFNYADDTAAAAAGIPIGGIYHNLGNLRIRIT